MEQVKSLNSERTYHVLVMSAAVILLILPFVTAFNELLTAFMLRIRLYVLIEDFVVPLEARVVAGLARALFGFEAFVAGKSILLRQPDQSFVANISWNCIGWQSMILFVFTCLTALRGDFTVLSKIKAVLIGLQGTILLNVARILGIIVVAIFWGYLPAIIIHDYAGTLILVLWLMAFWHQSFKYVLKSNGGSAAKSP